MQRPPLFESQFVDIGTEIAQGGSQALELLENRDELVTLTNAWRTLLEMRMACAAAQVYPGEVVLLDNGLLPWLSVGGSSAHRRLKEYLELLLALRPGLVAGVISGPQSRLLARLVNLAEAETVEQGIQDGHDIADSVLMRRLLQAGRAICPFPARQPAQQGVPGSRRRGVLLFPARERAGDCPRGDPSLAGRGPSACGLDPCLGAG